MTAYLFILGIWNRTRAELRFEHKVVMAESIDGAYVEGQRQAEEAGLLPIAEDDSANDYVVQLVAE